MSEELVASRVFTDADQALFAALSGDRNPMHMDSVAARRTQAGSPVVHGVHAVLWSLESLSAAGVPLTNLASIKVRFDRFIFLNRTVTLRAARRDEASMRVELVDDGLHLLSIVLEFGERGRGSAPTAPGDVPIVDGRTAASPSFEAMRNTLGRLLQPSQEDVLLAAFPTLANELDVRRISAMAQLSTLVGMVCPGLHSIFSSFSLNFVAGQGEPELTFRTTKADERFRMVTMAFTGWGVHGEIVAFARREPVEPPSIENLLEQVAPNEFAHVAALVVGGSRGLGAVTAKLIAAGGGRVTITYARGKSEAEKLQQEIEKTCGPGVCRAIQLDVSAPLADASKCLTETFNQLYYYATPQIFRQKSEVFVSDVYDEFARLYIHAFHELVQIVFAQASAPLSVFYPSSVAVAERPKGMTEYAMAKAAGELLCIDLERSNAGLRTIVARIPRTTTDQTSTIMPVESADPVDILLPFVRAMSEG